MPFEKGNKLGNGRPDGSKNKKTLMWQTFSEYCLTGGLKKFKKEIETLSGKDFVDAFVKILEFHKPKLSRSALDLTEETVNSFSELIKKAHDIAQQRNSNP